MSLRSMSLNWSKALGIAIASTVGFYANSSVAQTTPSPITPDGTLPTNSNVTLEGNTRTITGGTQAGGNLFHSFTNFSVPTGSEAFFNNGADIQNIINRVTGGSISDIDGLIRANGGANLFLINPNGIVFGPNARLNIGGSFYGTSANSMRFSDGSEFSAVNPQSPPLLTINVPLGLQFGNNPRNITVGNDQTEPTADSPTLLEVPTGETLALLGGDVNVNGERLRASGGRIELGGLASEGTVGINNDGSLTFPDGVARADVSLNGSELDVTGGGGGSIGINAGNINLLGGSDLCAGIGGDPACGGLASDTPGSVGSQAGDITLNATRDITGSGGVLINNRVNTGATGNSGNINIEARSLSMTDGAQISASTRGQGNAGSVTINANDLVKFDGEDADGFNSGAFSQVASNAVGNGGGVSITTGSLEVLNGAQINTLTSGQGDAGNIMIKADDLVKFDGSFPTGAFSQVRSEAEGNAGGVSITAGSLEVLNGARVNTTTFGRGNAGGVSITTGSLEVTNGAQVSASTFGQGNAGSVNINANDLVKFDGEDPNGNNSGAFSQVNSDAVGNAGGVSITTGSLEVLNGAEVSASTFGQGNAGSVTIKANDLVKFDGEGQDGRNSGARSTVGSNAVGNGGDVSITTGSLKVTNGAQISATTGGQGDAGSVTINANNLVKFDGEDADGNNSGAFSRVGSNAVGKAGGVSITTGSLEVTNGAEVDASTFGQGNAGSVTINANDLVKFDGEGEDGFNSGAFSQVNSDAVGNAGGVSITTGSLEVTNGAQLSASTRGQGNAGSVTINANDLVKFDGVGEDGNPSGAFSQVNSDGVGNAGGVSITTGSLEVLNGAQLSASTNGQGNAGSVTINANDLVKFDGEDEDGNNSGAFSRVNRNAVGKAGGVSITTGSLEVTNGAELDASTRGQGNAGSVTINANDLVKFDGEGEDGNNSRAISTVGSNARGNGGDVSITTGSLELTNGGQLSASTRGQGDAGSVTINANDLVKFDGEGKDEGNSGAFSQVGSNARGNAGGVSITTGSLEVTNGAQINAITLGQGDAGNVTINANNLVKFDGEDADGNNSGAFSRVESETAGNAGGISITTGTLEVLNGAEVDASTFGQGNAGSVIIKANDLVKFDGEGEDGFNSGAFSRVNSEAVGKAGGVSIFTGSLEVTNGALLSASTFGQGDAGSVTINANDLVKFDGEGADGINSGVFSQVGSNARGSAGGISITTGSLEITDSARVSASSFGQGNAGDIEIDAKSIRLDNDGTISTDTRSTDGDPQANINIRSRSLILRRRSNITANARGEGVIGGNITINTGVLAGYENSDITANSRDDRGGNVVINAEGVFGIRFREQLSPLSDITATGENNQLPGNVEIDTTESDPTRGLGEVEADTVDASNQIYDPCVPGSRGFGNSFVSIGRGGLPMTPTEPLQDTSTISTWVRLKPQASSRTNRKTTNRKTSSQPTTVSKTPKVEKQTETEKPTQIVEATGWIVNAQGNIEFVAQANHTNPKSPWQNPASCSVSGK